MLLSMYHIYCSEARFRMLQGYTNELMEWSGYCYSLLMFDPWYLHCMHGRIHENAS